MIIYQQLVDFFMAEQVPIPFKIKSSSINDRVADGEVECLTHRKKVQISLLATPTSATLFFQSMHINRQGEIFRYVSSVKEALSRQGTQTLVGLRCSLLRNGELYAARLSAHAIFPPMSKLKRFSMAA